MQSGFGQTLKQLRRDLGLSQEALAANLGSTQRHVSFLETGRSIPSQTMIGRMATELNLSTSQRAALFGASGHPNPYRRRSFSSTEVIETLDMLEKRVLRHWPFPAFVMDEDWNLLRMNRPAQMMFGIMGNNTNLLALFVSQEFSSMIENWEEASTAFYFRMQKAAAHNETVRIEFEAARKRGMFEHITKTLTNPEEIPIYVPVILRLPTGQRLKITSIIGNLVSVQDALVEGFDIELMLPMDDMSEQIMSAAGS